MGHSWDTSSQVKTVFNKTVLIEILTKLLIWFKNNFSGLLPFMANQDC